jgi:hypothetical protein
MQPGESRTVSGKRRRQAMQCWNRYCTRYFCLLKKNFVFTSIDGGVIVTRTN